MQLATDPVVLLFRPYLDRTHPLDRLLRRLHRARQHEADRLKQRDRRGLQLPVTAADSGLADVSRDQMDALHLRARHVEGLADRSLDQALAQADPHLTRDDLDHEPCRLRLDALQQPLEWSGLGAAACGADLLKRCGHLIERDVRALRATLQGLARPVAEVRMLAPDLPELFFRATRKRGHSLVDLPPAEPERLPFRRTKGAPAHVDGGQAKVVIRI